MALIRCIVALCLSLCIYFVVEVGLMLIVGIWVAWFGWIGRLWVLWLDQIGGLEFGWLWVGWIGWRWVDAWVVWCGGGVGVCRGLMRRWGGGGGGWVYMRKLNMCVMRKLNICVMRAKHV